MHTATIEFYSIIFLCQSFVGKTREMKGVKRDENKRENGVPNQLEWKRNYSPVGVQINMYDLFISLEIPPFPFQNNVLVYFSNVWYLFNMIDFMASDTMKQDLQGYTVCSSNLFCLVNWCKFWETIYLSSKTNFTFTNSLEIHLNFKNSSRNEDQVAWANFL